MYEAMWKAFQRQYGDRSRYAVACSVKDPTGSTSIPFDAVVLPLTNEDEFGLSAFQFVSRYGDVDHSLRGEKRILDEKLAMRDFSYYHIVIDCEMDEKWDIPEEWGIWKVKDGELEAVRHPKRLRENADAKITASFMAAFVHGLVNTTENSELSAAIPQKVLYEIQYKEGYDAGKRSVREQTFMLPDGKTVKAETAVQEVSKILKALAWRREALCALNIHEEKDWKEKIEQLKAAKELTRFFSGCDKWLDYSLMDLKASVMQLESMKEQLGKLKEVVEKGQE